MRLLPNEPLRDCLLTGALAITALPLVSAADSDRRRDGDDDRRGNDMLLPGNLLVSRTVYSNNPATVKVGEILPPDCAATTGGCSAPSGAPFDGTYPTVWNDDLYDASFGIASRIFLDEMSPLAFRSERSRFPPRPLKADLPPTIWSPVSVQNRNWP
jgi:hypothetical protein